MRETMKSLVFVLLIALAGCATTHRAPEPMVSAPERPLGARSETAQPAPAPTPAPSSASVPDQEPASIARTPVPMASEASSPAVHVPAHQPESPVEQSSSSVPVQRPVTASIEPRPSSPERRKLLVTEPGEYPIPDHKLQKLTELAASNDEKMLNVFIGLYQKTVERIMASERNPYRKSMITGKDGDIYEVLFYLTREPRRGRPVTDRMLTPVIFKDDRVVGIGNYQLKKLKRDGILGRRKTAATAVQ